MTIRLLLISLRGMATITEPMQKLACRHSPSSTTNFENARQPSGSVAPLNKDFEELRMTSTQRRLQATTMNG